MPKRQKTAITVHTAGHPQSRKALKMFKNNAKQATRQKSKMVTAIKQNVIGERILWFKERIPSDVPVCSKSVVDQLLQLYLGRFDEEMEQIEMKHSIGQRKGRQHASRQDIIRHTQQLERTDYNTCGLEIPNLLDEAQMKTLRDWNGELRFLQNFKLVRLGKKHLQESEDGTEMSSEQSVVNSSVTEEDKME